MRRARGGKEAWLTSGGLADGAADGFTGQVPPRTAGGTTRVHWAPSRPAKAAAPQQQRTARSQQRA